MWSVNSRNNVVRTMTVLAGVMVLGLAGCAALAPDAEQPQLSITSFKLAPESAGAAPMFDIGLRLINPGRSALNLRGMSYTIEIDGHRILTGASADLPQVPAYGTADFTLQATPDLFGSLRLVNELFSSPKQQHDYTFTARLDAGGFGRRITLRETGRFGGQAQP